MRIRNATPLWLLLTVLGISLLLLLAGCGSPPTASVQLLTSAGTPIPPAPEESYPEGEFAAVVPPATPEPYVPPPPESPWPTAEPVPTATPRPTIAAGRVVRGWGNFPRLPVVAMARDDGALALYLVQGDTATLLVGFDELTPEEPETHLRFRAIDGVDAKLSPGGRYVACQTSGYAGDSTIEVVDTQDPQRIVLYQTPPVGKGPGGGGDPPPYSFTWLDETHLLYTVRPWPSTSSCWESPPCTLPGELWEVDLNGGKQRLLIADRLDEVLGVSPDGQRAYLLRFGADWIPGGQSAWYGLYSLDLTTGMTATLWPQASDPWRYTGYTLQPFPGGGQRVLFRTWYGGDTVGAGPTVIWRLDPATGTAEPIWTVDRGEEFKGAMIYDVPTAFLWSPLSEQDFIYAGIWWVDLAAQQSYRLREEWGQLLTWAAEGIVVQKSDDDQMVEILQLLGEDGQVQGEIDLSP